MESTDYDRRIKSSFTKSLSRTRICLYKGCKNLAIQSHVIQRKGVLDKITFHNHVYQVKFHQFPNFHYKIKRIGWKDALTFNGLCSHHDTNLFKQIETSEIDLNQYQSLSLLSLRPLLYEYRLKEVMLDTFSSDEVQRTLNPVSFIGIRELINAQSYMMSDLNYMINAIYNDLENSNNNYIFKTFQVPKIDICTSVVFSIDSLADSFPSFPKIDIHNRRMMTNILFHAIPMGETSTIIIGYLKGIEKNNEPYFEKLDRGISLKEVSDILIKNCSHWACSEPFYLEYIKPREYEINKLLKYFSLRKQFSDEVVSINLFDNK